MFKISKTTEEKEKGIFTVTVEFTKKCGLFFLNERKEIDEIIFSIKTGNIASQNGLIRKGSLNLACHKYHKKYGVV